MNEEMRKEFEDWYKLTLISESKCSHKEREALFDYSFMVWQASREAMKPIKLPVVNLKMPMDYRIGFSRAVYDCEEAIQLAGYKAEE